MSESMMPTPADEHRMLMENVGTWKVACRYFMEPDKPPMEATATETVEPVGSFWTVSKFESDFGGMPFVGRATLGYDTHKQKWVGTWIDAMSCVLYSYEGDYDAATRTLTMLGTGVMPHMGGECEFRNTLAYLEDGNHRFEMFVTPPGGSEAKMFTYDYERTE